MDTNEEQAWRAVLSRDAAFDGAFVYAVTTTGVFCQPTCPSRRPRRENVRFFATPIEARREGFRPCRRCRPESSGGSATERAVLAAMTYVDDHPDEDVTLDRIAAAVAASPHHLQREFTRLVGMSPRQYVEHGRWARFRRGVKEGKGVVESSYAAGFGSSRGLYEHARRAIGMTPGAYARGGAGVVVRRTFVDCDLGRALVAATGDGICSVLLGDDDGELAAEMAAQLPQATMDDDATVRRDWVDAVVRHLNDTRIPLAVDLDYRGTPFQIRVWDALRAIEPGETRSYAELAASIGSPRAVRAVATACASNTIAVLVPCHRIVRKDGALGGYRWGVERKRALLAREAATRSSGVIQSC